MNTFFKGSIDDLLQHISEVTDDEIDGLLDPNRKLNREELIHVVMDDFKKTKEEAEKIVTEIQMEELDRILKIMLEKGLVEITEYDENGDVLYLPTEKGIDSMKQYKK